MSQHEQLADLLRALWPALVRAVRVAEQLPPLPEAQVAVLRTLVAAGGLTPGQLAVELGLARPTISNIVTELAQQGLVERRPSLGDGRSVRLLPTTRARDLLASFRRGRAKVLDHALKSLPPEHGERLLSALPALELLLVQLEASSTTNGVGRHG